MITLTVTLKDTPHQVVLAFETAASADLCRKSMSEQAGGDATLNTAIRTEDDFGKSASWAFYSAVALEWCDLESYWDYRNKVSLIKLRAEAKFNIALGQDPSLAPMVGGVRPEFGSR